MPRAFLALITLIAATGCTPRPADDYSRLQGIWAISDVNKAEWNIPPESEAWLILSTRFQFSGDRMLVTDGNAILRDSTFTLNRQSNPPQITLVSRKDGSTSVGIYRLPADNTLQICTSSKPTQRPPAEFKSIEREQLAFLTLRKITD